MKNLYPLLLGALVTATNSNPLLAQDEYNQGTGYRLQGLIRSQDTGCRVQDENRLKATNQVIGCRLQVVGCNQEAACTEQVRDSSKKTLPLEDQITQGAKATKNYNNQATGYRLQGTGLETTELLSEKLRTKNCDNQGDDLDCYLQMDPMGWGKEVEKLEKYLEESRKNNTLAKNHSSTEEEQSFSQKGEMSNRAVMPLEKSNLIAHCQDDKNVSEISNGNNNVEGQKVIFDDNILNNAIGRINKALETGDLQTTEVIKEGKETIVQLVAYHTTHADELYSLEKIDEGDSCYSAALSATQALKQIDKVIEARLAGRSETAAVWDSAVNQDLLAYDYYVHAAKTYALGKSREGNSKYTAAEASFSAAQKIGKSIEAELDGQPEIAKKWRETIKQNQLAFEYFTSAAVAHTSCYKYDEAKIWDGSGIAASQTAEQMTKAIEAEASGKLELAESWNEIVKQSQVAQEYYTRALSGRVSQKWYESSSWRDAGRAAMEVAEQMDKVIEAEVAGKLEIAQAWRTAIKQNQLASEYYTHAATAHNASGEDYDDGSKDKVGAMWDNAGNAALEAAQQVEKAIEAKTAGASTEGERWSEILKQNQLACEYYTHAAIAYASGRISEGAIWGKAGRAALDAAEHIDKAIEAETSGKMEIATAWREVVRQHQLAIDHYTHLTTVYASEQNYDDCFIDMADNMRDSATDAAVRVAEQIGKAIEAGSNGKLEVAQSWREAVKQNQLAIEYFDHAAIAYASGKINEGVMWSNIARAALEAARKIDKAIEAETNGKMEEAKKYREEAEKK